MASRLNQEIHASTYRDFEELRGRMEEFIEGYYNVCRLHSARLSFARRLRKRVPTRIPESFSGGNDVLRRLMRASSRAFPSKEAAMHIFVSARGSLFRISVGTQLYTNCARTSCFQPIGVSF
jgi:hypothetical protein